MLDFSKCDFIAPSIKLMPSFVAALKEGHLLNSLSKESTADEISIIENDQISFLENLISPPEFITLPNGENVKRVPQTIFWLCDNDEFLGQIGIRHYLNDNLRKFGGHIGYTVRPKYRGLGVASEMLRRSLIYCRSELKLDEVLMDCDQDNIASMRVIEKSGGAMFEIAPNRFEPDKLSKRYWVPTL